MEKVQHAQQINYGRGNVISLEKGKIPPQATDLEEVVLGAMMKQYINSLKTLNQ